MKHIISIPILFVLLINSCSMDKSEFTRFSSNGNSEVLIHKNYPNDYYTNLTDLEKNVIHNKGTEQAFTGDLLDNKVEGLYLCRACGAVLFESTSKFESGTGWPSFDAPFSKVAVGEISDNSHGMIRTEVTCNNCNGHLGHVFNDGPTQTGLRYCINSCALDFESKSETQNHYDTIILGGGCFWCVEAIYELLDGVISVESGYSGGKASEATYDQVSSGTTNHAEVVQIIYNPVKVSLYEILEVFFSSHDPTTLNSQGADHGTQYRSVIFYTTDNQKENAEKIIQELTTNKIYNDPIVTEISKFSGFYSAEKYHQDYYKNNPKYGYCHAVITPKVEKFKKIFADNLKK